LCGRSALPQLLGGLGPTVHLAACVEKGMPENDFTGNEEGVGILLWFFQGLRVGDFVC